MIYSKNEAFHDTAHHQVMLYFTSSYEVSRKASIFEQIIF